jgi:hypothetical protein
MYFQRIEKGKEVASRVEFFKDSILRGFGQ